VEQIEALTSSPQLSLRLEELEQIWKRVGLDVKVHAGFGILQGLP
jgi:hypothetical protein